MAFPQLAFSNFQQQSDFLTDDDLYEVRTENNSMGQILYIGKTIYPNASTADPVWYIKKINYDSNGYVDYVQLPINALQFGYIWDNRASYFP